MISPAVFAIALLPIVLTVFTLADAYINVLVILLTCSWFSAAVAKTAETATHWYATKPESSSFTLLHCYVRNKVVKMILQCSFLLKVCR